MLPHLVQLLRKGVLPDPATGFLFVEHDSSCRLLIATF